MDISIFLKSYWHEYEKNEEKELLTLAKNLGIKAPPKKNKEQYDSFIKEMTKRLEYGYIYRTGHTRLGGVYEKIDKPSMRTQLKLLKKRQHDLPIRIELDQIEFESKSKIYTDLLNNLTKEQLIACILNAPKFKSYISYTISQEPTQTITKVVKERTKARQPETSIYSTQTIDELKTILTAQRALLEQLQKQQKTEEIKNLFPLTISDKKIKELVLPMGITPQDKIKWNRLVEQITKPKANLITRQTNVNQLREIYKTYQTNNNKQNEIKSILQDVRKLNEAISLKKENKQQNQNGDEITQLHYQQIVPIKYPKLDKTRIIQLIYAVRRKLLPKELVYLVELYDLNELTNVSRVKYASKRQRIISSDIYIKIKKDLFRKIQSISPNFKAQFKQALQQAVGLISQATGINIIPPTTNLTVIVKKFVKGWSPTWNGEVVKDVYGQNVFETLLASVSPFSFYSAQSNKVYETLVKKFTPPKQETYTRAQAMHDGKWYNVQFLDKNPVSGQPSLIYKSELELNPKTKRYEVVNKISTRNGVTPYIKIVLRTEQSGENKEIWKEVRPGEIKKRQTL